MGDNQTTSRVTDLVTVCAACRTEACWQGQLMCADAWWAGTTLVPAAVAERP